MADKWAAVDEQTLQIAQQNAAGAQKRVGDLLAQKERADKARLDPLVKYCREYLHFATLKSKNETGVARHLAANAKDLRELLAPFDQ